MYAHAVLAAIATAAMLAGISGTNATVIRESCPAPSATGICAYADQRVIYAPANASRFAIEHERGHIYDHDFLDDGERNALKRATGFPITREWRLGTGMTHEAFLSPSERFADLYAACRLRMDPETRWESAYDYQPSRRAFRRACGVVRRASLDYGDGTTR